MVNRELDSNELPGFELPMLPCDETIARLRERYDLPRDASLAQIEPVAVQLLKAPLTCLSAAELVLNRRVDIRKERAIAELILFSGEPEDKFAYLLLEKSAEDLMREQGETDFGTSKSIFK